MLSLVGIACTVNTQNNSQISYNLTYNFDKSDKLDYSSVHSIEKPKKTVSENIEMLVSDVGKNHIAMQVTSITTTNENKTEDCYNMNMTAHGNLIELNSKNLTIPEIQPELPNTLKYPATEIKKDDVWRTTFDKVGNVTSTEGVIEYDLVSMTEYKCIGLKTISVDAGNFNCVGIRSDMNFTLNMTTTSYNKTIYTITTGNTSGEDWVDSKGGFLVKSEHNANKIIKTDYSDTYKEIGFEKFYRETPLNSYTVSELTNFQ